MERKSVVLAFAFFCFISFNGLTQTVVTNETFPNQFNTSFGSSNSSNGTFVGSTGTWTSSVNSNSLCAIAVIQAYYSPVTYAIKIVNWNTSGKAAADAHAASPTVNLSGYTCAPSLDLSFKLYTYTTSANDPNSFFKVEFSNDNGSTWTSFHSWSSQYIANNYPQNGLTTVSVSIPAAYRVSGFKYRFSGYKPANQANNFYLFVDDAKITATSCTPSCNGKVTNLYFNELNGGPDIPITNGSTFTVAQLGSLYNMEAGTSGTVGSVKFTITGPSPTSNIENAVPYNSPGTGSGAWTGAVGSYSVNLKTYNAAGAGGTLCHDTTITFILASTVTLGNRVWYDANNNGINDASENGIRNVSVKLYLDANNDNIPDGPSIASATTDVNGYYSFTGLSNGNYIVGVVMPDGYMSSDVNGGDPDNNTDLDDNGQVFSGNEVRGLAITLASGTEPGGNTNNTYDFGLLPDCACTNSAGNLLVNASFENGTTGWSTGSNGTLTTGTGYIACGTKNGFNNWSSGGAHLVWQDVNIATGSTVTFSAFAGTHAPGIACSPKLSLIFLNSSNAIIGQTDVTVTRVVGDYNNQLEHYSITAVAPAGTVKARVQSSITCNTMKLDAFCLTAVAPLGSIGDRVWKDDNRNGIQDAGEAGIAGVTMELLNASNTVIATTTTNESGIYNFSNLPAGNYSVRVTPPANYNASPKTQGADLALDSDFDPATFATGTITLATGQNRTDIDAGLFLLINLSGNVWHDANALLDNLVNMTSPNGIPTGLRVYLVNASTGLIERSTIVNPVSGTFSFTDINPLKIYRLYLSSVSYPVGSPETIFPLVPIIPGGWEHTGQKNANPPNSPLGSDGINDGQITVPVGVTDVININFGIRTKGGDVVQG